MKGYPNSENQWVNHKDMSADEAITEFQHSCIRTMHTDGESSSPSSLVTTALMPASNNSLTASIPNTPIMQEELQDTVRHFPLLPYPARLSPDNNGLTPTLELLTTR